MPLANDGRNFIAGAITGKDTTLFDNDNTRIGVGDSDTDFDASHSDLQGSNTHRESVDSGYPERDPEGDGSDNKLKYQATFGGDDANFTWEEWGLFNSGSGGTMLNRLVEYNGTKEPGQTWIFEVEIEVQIGS